MRKLLSANFARMWKSRDFWCILAAVFVICLASTLLVSNTVQELLEIGYEVIPDQYFFLFAPYLGVFLAAFVSLFLGTEYSDGAIRNKLIVGHRRVEIYLANFLTCFAAGCLFLAVWWIASVPFLFLAGPLEMGISGFALYALVAVGSTASFAALYTLLGSLSSNKALTVIFTLAAWVGLILTGSGLIDRLNEPEFDGGMAYITGAFVEIPQAPNPHYLTGMVRAVCEYLRDLLPTGQMILMNDASIEHPVRQILLSLVLTVCVTAAGIAAFRRKDIR